MLNRCLKYEKFSLNRNQTLAFIGETKISGNVLYLYLRLPLHSSVVFRCAMHLLKMKVKRTVLNTHIHE